MDKLLGILADFLKLLFTVSPATAVLFLFLCAALWALRFLYLKNQELQKEAVAQQVTFHEKLTGELAKREKEYRGQLSEKENELSVLHERTFERDQAQAKILDNLRVSINRSNQSAIIQSSWNGIEAICKFHQLDGRAVGLMNHMIPAPAQEIQ